MIIGDVVTVSYEGRTSNLNVFAIDEEKNPSYTVYRLINQGEQHLLYVKRGFTLPEWGLDIKGHIIIYEDEVKGADYYIMVNKDSVLPM